MKFTAQQIADYIQGEVIGDPMAYVGGFSKISVLVSQFNAKQIINSESCKAALSFRRIKLASEHFKKDELLTVQKWFAFSVRPPPFLI